MSEIEAISIKEYARRKGCSDTAVRKAIAAGKITKGVIDRDTKRPKILPSVADKEWATNFNPAYVRDAPIQNKLLEQVQEAPPAPVPDGRKSLAELKRLQAEVRLQHEAILLREKKGQLVDKDHVYRALFEAGQQIRSAMMAMPDRVIDGLMAADSRNEAHTILTQAIIEALEVVTNVEASEVIK